MKTILKYIIFFSLLLISISSCDVNLDFEGDKYGDTIIRGIVVDKADSTPLDSALIQIYSYNYNGGSGSLSYEFYTDSIGEFYDTIFCASTHFYEIETCKEGYYNPSSNYDNIINSREDNYFFIEMIKDTTKAK